MKTLNLDGIRPISGDFISSGRVKLMCTADVFLWAEHDEIRKLVAIGREIDVKIPPGQNLTIETKGKCFLIQPLATVNPSEGEVYSNADQMPMGGSTDAVKAAVRMVRLENRQFLAKQRKEMLALKAQMILGKPDAEAQTETPEPTPAPVPAEPSGESEDE